MIDSRTAPYAAFVLRLARNRVRGQFALARSAQTQRHEAHKRFDLRQRLTAVGPEDAESAVVAEVTVQHRHHAPSINLND